MSKSRKREFDFTLVLTGIAEVGREAENALFDAGCDDATIIQRSGRVFLTFSRSSSSLKSAVLSAIDDVRRAKIRANVLRIDSCSLVTQSEIARRIGRSRQQVHQYIAGTRGPGDFPPAICDSIEGAPLWHWCEVARWLHRNDVVPAGVWHEAEEIEAINNVLALQQQQRENVGLLKEVARSILPRKTSAALLSNLN